MQHCNSWCSKDDVCLVGHNGRQQVELAVDCHHRHKHTENNIHTSEFTLCLSEVTGYKSVMGGKLFLSRKAYLSVSHSRLPEVWRPLSHLFSCYLGKCCIMYLRDIYTYFLGIWLLKFTVKHVAHGSYTEQAREVRQGLLITPAAGPGKVAGKKRVV